MKFSLIKKNVALINKQKQGIENQRELAIEEIKLEEAKTDFRERNSHNKLVEDLQNNIKKLEINSEKEKVRNSELLNQLKTELNNRKEITSDEIRSFEKQYSNTRIEMKLLNEKIFEKDNQIQELQMLLNENKIRLNSENSLEIIFENGLKIVQKNNGNKIEFINYNTNEKYNFNEVEKFKKKYRHEINYIA
ncbi:hypothetical protein G1K77_13470 [Tenacibaculum finnmarkense]|uniref:hypothetical protein n=1 Tax=Tenacibaculum finnmarkense TaxID=2781243 RepID=UPI00187B3FF0|nr:hypothetical protein [Tenacibaculum finnmarkense]MBE7661540.1 hypothetical protein [Tenacibaculum finnmarkense genomovar finnmarkense]MCG8816779.1 hypothetical protein [Tenacibaculum finnmarkense]MCG8821765.1 hypothetical protein [Tenacibaculum finnmarkense]